MAEQERDRDIDIDHPLSNVLHTNAGQKLRRTYTAGLIGTFVVLGVVLMFWLWSGRRVEPGAQNPNLTPPVGTSGSVENQRQGGGEPQSRPNSTGDELEHRGAAEP